ncbi:MAG: hypothetical protein HY293_08275 [Planctomycetes bacterium]|nr:hypothetical protein [Planctomycetota bacterium]
MGPLLLALVESLSLYVWVEPDDKLLAFCAEKKVTRLYLMFSGKETPKLRPFVQAAHAAKIEVHAMHPGDMAEWLDPFPARLDPKPILDWVDAALKTGLFDGIHLDLEPHAAPQWKSDRLKLAAGYLDLLRQVRAKGKFTFSAAVPHNWDRDELKIDGKPLIEHVQDLLDYVSVMAYRGRNIEKVLESIEHECRYKPGKVELIQETDPKAVEEGVPLHVGTASRLEEIFAAARLKFGPALPLAVHHYGTWRDLAR